MSVARVGERIWPLAQPCAENGDQQADNQQANTVDDSGRTRDELLAELQRLRRQVKGQRPPVGREAAAPRGDGELLQTIVANVPILVFALDRHGVITLSEGKGLELLGLKPGEQVGMSALQVYGGLPQIEQKLRRALSGQSVSTCVELGEIEFEMWHTPLRDEKGETAGVAGIAIEVTQRTRAEEQLRAAQHTMQRMLHSHERDRRLMAYEIHDGLVQDATGAQMQLDALIESDQLPAGPAGQQVQRAAELVRKAVSEARRLIAGLRPPILDELGVVPALEYLVDGARADGPPMELVIRVGFDRLEPLLEASIYRIVQEAIANAKRHSRSDRVEIRLTQVDDRIHIEVQDWGVGFDPAQVTANRFGLQGIRERARLLRGRAVIDSATGKGTRVFVDLPIAEALEEVTDTDSWSIE